MGFVKDAVFQQATGRRIFSFVSFFVRSESRFFVPTRSSLAPARAEAVKVGRHIDLTTGSAVARPRLDSFEHDGTLGAIGMTIGGGAPLAGAINRATTLYPVGLRTRTMMQSCASAAKLRSGGPILPFGIKAKETRRDPATSNRHRRHRHKRTDKAESVECPSRPPFMMPAAERRRPALRPPARAAIGRSVACAPRPRS